MSLADAIVRDLAAKKPPAHNGTCLLCHFADEDEATVNHSSDCPYRRAVEYVNSSSRDPKLDTCGHAKCGHLRMCHMPDGGGCMHYGCDECEFVEHEGNGR